MSRQLCGKIALYVIMILVAVIMATPFVYMVSVAFKTPAEMIAYPPKLLPKGLYLENFRQVWDTSNLSQYFLNTVIVSVVKTALVVMVAALAAYPFAKLDFPLRDVLFMLVLATLMIPYQVTLIPLFVLVKKIPLVGGNNILGEGGTGLLNTLWALIIPGFVSPVGIFLLRQFISTLPDELFDAARIDGCTEIGIFSKMVLPLIKPAITALSIMTFQGAWNDFVWPLLVTQSQSVWTLQVALSQLQTQFSGSEWAQLMAGTVISVIPLLTVFMFGQRHFVEGVAFTGMK
ncbi:MAG: carbohydrate ABC transporter permease [Firmicutes bacterium]|nr:carbohydrate ABC transporter permease [Bacillota bacterium]